MFSAFGVANRIGWPSGQRRFYNKPPVSMTAVGNKFVPDYTVLLLADKVIFDEASLVQLLDNPDESYQTIADMFEVLKDKKLIEVADYSSVLEENKTVLDKMLRNDFSATEQWVPILRESNKIWDQFVEQIPDLTDYDKKSLLSKKLTGKQLNDITFLKKTLRPHLTNANANIVLSNQLGAGFYDWADFQPFYQKKFCYAGLNVKVAAEVEEAQKRFEFLFPTFKIRDIDHLIELLKDKRVRSFREVVQQAANGEPFTKESADIVLKEVHDIDRSIKKFEKIIAFLTAPMSLLQGGSLVRDASRSIANALVDGKLKADYQWFYFIKDHTYK